MHNYAHLKKGSTIVAPGQLEYYKNKVDDKSRKVGGTQCIKTLDGYTIPMTIKNGLARLKIRPYLNQEWDTLPHVILTGPNEWDPTVLDTEDDLEWYDAPQVESNRKTNLFNEYGD